MPPRLLTKSRFKIACECPTKLAFTGKKEYGNNKLDNAFLEALAEGGFQVGELAKLYHPGGIDIETVDVAQAVKETAELLKQDSVILYEPAILFENLLVRVDVLIKRSSDIQLIEVKAKSFDPSEESPFYNKRDLKKGITTLNSEWEPYLQDIAYQTYVVRQAYPRWSVTSSLMLADKSATASVDGLNQRFFLESDEKGRTRARVKADTTTQDLGDPVLIRVPVDAEVAHILSSNLGDKPFAEYVSWLAHAYETDTPLPPTIGGQCKSCEFRISADKKAQGLKSGFEQCWSQAAGVKAQDFDQLMVFDIWNFRKSAALIEERRYWMHEVEESDVSPKPRNEESGLSSSERQWLQVRKSREGDTTPYLDEAGLRAEMASWTYPLHLIDFETTMVAIPFNKGRRPYEQMAFQFSHHVLNEDGTTEHRDEYIHLTRGGFPNFDFVRALKKALSTDQGTVFRYAAHENTVLCQIREQLGASEETDRAELIAFIESITSSTGDSVQEWKGRRSMVDLCDLVKRYYYDPATQGSNSIKKVLPAILGSSEFLQKKYGSPTYSSRNYHNWQWIKKDASSHVIDPYKQLPPIFSDLDLETMDSLITDGSLADGGAAMTAYARMQFTEMSDTERERVKAALLRYCELDTLAMVMIVEHWRNQLSLE